MNNENLNPPDFYSYEVEEIEPIEENNIENILNHLTIISHYDRKEAATAIKMILEYSNESGVNLSDVRQLLSDIYETL